MNVTRIIRTAAQLRAVVADLVDLPVEQPLQITIAPAKTKRTIAQNSFYWGVLLTTIRDRIYETTGQSFSVDDLHAECKRRFGLIDGRKRLDGGREYEPRSTTKYSVAEMAVYLTAIESWAIDSLDCQIPLSPDRALAYGETTKQEAA